MADIKGPAGVDASPFYQRLKRFYDRWLVDNASVVGPAESTLRGLMFFVPSKFFGESESGTELAYAGIGLMTLYHDCIYHEHNREKLLQKYAALRKAPSGAPLFSSPTPSSFPPSSPFSNQRANDPSSILQTAISKMPSVQWVKLVKWLVFIQTLELFVEMYARKYWSKRKRMTVVFLIESFKALIKLCLLWQQRGGIVVHQSVPARDEYSVALSVPVESDLEDDDDMDDMDGIGHFDDGFPRPPSSPFASSRSPAAHTPSPLDCSPKRNHGPRPTMRRTRQTLMGPPSSASDANPRRADEKFYQPTASSPLLAAGEVLHILRPIAHLATMSITHEKSWIPWLVALGVDIGSSACTTDTRQLNEMEVEELKRRNRLLLYYLLRSPCFEFLTENPSMVNLYKKFSWVPLVNRIPGSFLWDYVLQYQKYYFYSAST